MRVPGRLAWFAVLFSVVTAGGFFVWSKGIDVGRLPNGTGAVVFTDRTGLPLGTVFASDDNHAAWVPLGSVAPQFVSAIVAAEDARFYEHGAVDFGSLLRAMREYIVYGEARSGGSTITMQLARSLHPTPSTIRGKFAQIVYAERIALRSSREAILEAYINRVPMGGNVYGIEAAARTYFGVSSRDLDLAQAALLAAIPNDPSRFYPYSSESRTGLSGTAWKALRARQRYVLDRMLAIGSITQAQHDAAVREELHLLPQPGGLAIAQHLLFRLYASLPHGTTQVRTTQVRTTIDAALQRFVQAQVAQVVAALQARHVTDAAALVIDNRTGDVLAYVGSPDYFSDAILGQNDGVQALRQPGSSLKPFTYELALERGAIRPNSILLDVPTAYAIPGGKLYTPADYSTKFAGPVRVRYALANSLNVPAVRVLSLVGVDALLERLHELGFTHLDKPAAYYGLGLTLGSGEVSLWELTHAYLTIAREGDAIPLRTALYAQAPETAVRLKTPMDTRSETSAGNRATWLLVTDMLADAHARAKSFGLHSVLEMPFPAAVKTGTSSDFRDTWTVGFSREYTVGVWVGNFDGSPMRQVSGVTGAGPLWNRIMLHLHETQDPPAFPNPPGYIRTPICATTGKRPDPTCRAVVTEWLKPADVAILRDAPHSGAPQDDKKVFAIVSPRDGDVFALMSPNDPNERILLRASRTQGVRWSANGAAVPAGFWQLRLGTWDIAATDGKETARVRIRIIPPPRNSQPGFTFR